MQLPMKSLNFGLGASRARFPHLGGPLETYHFPYAVPRNETRKRTPAVFPRVSFLSTSVDHGPELGVEKLILLEFPVYIVSSVDQIPRSVLA